MTVVFLSCVKTKQNKKCKAKDMYISPLFKNMLAYARTLTTDSNIYILSAKYGVLSLNDVIEPYNLTLKTMSVKKRKMWANYCLYQMRAKKINRRQRAYFLCGERYREYIIGEFHNAITPLKGLSHGKQIKYLKEHI